MLPQLSVFGNLQNGGLAASITACGVTPQAQNSGTSPGRMSGSPPYSGLAMSAMPIAAGSPKWIGAPCTRGKREVISMARMALATVKLRIDTTMRPWKRPAGTVSSPVR